MDYSPAAMPGARQASRSFYSSARGMERAMTEPVCTGDPLPCGLKPVVLGSDGCYYVGETSHRQALTSMYRASDDVWPVRFGFATTDCKAFLSRSEAFDLVESARGSGFK